MTGNENKIRLYDYFDANEKMAEADPEEKRDTCVDFAVMFALERGILKEDAEKLRAALVGTYTQSKGVDVSPQSILTPGSLSLVTWKIHICDVTKIIRLKDQIWQPVGGNLVVPGRNNTKSNIVLRKHTKEDPQTMLAISIEKKGLAYFDDKNTFIEQPFFWTYGGVILQTENQTGKLGEEIPGKPLTLAFNVNAQANNDGMGKNISGRWSPSMYLTRDEDDPTKTVNRLDSLFFGPNHEQRFLEALIHAGFPVHTARINRQASTNRNSGWVPSRNTAPARSLATTAPSMSPPVLDGDPFED